MVIEALGVLSLHSISIRMVWTQLHRRITSLLLPFVTKTFMFHSINKNPPEISFMAVQFKLIMAVSWHCQTNPGFNPYLPPVTWLTRLTICVKTSNIEIVKIYNYVFSSRLRNQGEVNNVKNWHLFPFLTCICIANISIIISICYILKGGIWCQPRNFFHGCVIFRIQYV